MVIPPGVNPNSINLEYAISAVEQEGVKEGMSRSQLDAVEASMRTSAASTTDFRKHFFDTGSASKDTVMFKLLSFFGLVKEADAATGLPFGGKVYYISPCTCTLGAAWMMIISPLPPTYANILTYIVGTELFLSYNLPFSVALLGFYTPGVPACVMGFYPACAPAPNFGVIQPVVGSAPI
jgi:hypothetical protein